MAAFNTNPVRVPFGAVTVHAFVSAVDGILREAAAWRRASRTRAQLAELPAHLRSDLGLDGVDLDALSERLARR